MPQFVNQQTISFNGPASVADQYSEPVNLTGSPGVPHSWFFVVNITTQGVWAVTLQFQPDPQDIPTSFYGWRDEARSSITVFNTATCANLAQSDAAISSGLTRAGVLPAAAAIGAYPLLLSWTPGPFRYRLRFQNNAAFVGNIPKISFSTGG